MKAYKVVRHHKNKRVSLSMGVPGWQTIYPVRKWAEARSGGLFVFDTYANAATFAQANSFWMAEIWECDVEDRFLTVTSVPYMSIVCTAADFECFWGGTHGPAPLMPVPKGTLLFQRVKLTQKMPNPAQKEAA